MLHLLVEAAREHVWPALGATANMVVAVLTFPAVFGAEIPDAVLTGGLLFVLATFTSIAGWALVLVVKLSQTVARLESNQEDHERRLDRLDG